MTFPWPVGTSQRPSRRAARRTGRQGRRRHDPRLRLDLQPLEPRLALAIDATLVADLNAAPRHSFTPDAARAFERLGELLVFAADDGIRGTELWRSDGTATGTFLLRDIRPDEVVDPSGSLASRAPPGARPTEFFVSGSTLYFSADDGVVGRELWRTDGTAAGTVLVSDIAVGPDGSSPGAFAALGSTVLFAASRFVGSAGLERGLWRTDETAGGARPVDAEGLLGITDPRLLTTLGDSVYFVANGTEVWRTDGTVPGTALVHAGTGVPGGLFALGSRLVFTVDAASAGQELWALDDGGSQAVPIATFGRPVAPPTGGGAAFVVVPGTATAVFAADDGLSGSQVWRTDGTAAGTTLVTSINATGPASPQGFAAFADGVYFQADDGVHGAELWRTDGTADGTLLVSDIQPGPIGSRPEYLAPLDGALHFSAAGFGADAELWRSDGTATGTRLVRDIAPAGASRPGRAAGRLVPVGGRLLFTADDGAHGVELWRTDGTAAGTALVGDISPSTADAFPAGGGGDAPAAAVFDGTLYFSTTFTNPAGVGGTVELWKREGDAAPERLQTIGSELVDPDTGAVLLDAAALAPAQFTRSGRFVYFTSAALDTDAKGTRSTLWRTDGTPAGTVRLHDDVAGASAHDGTRPSPHLVDLDGTLLFAGRDPWEGMELWRTDGTAAGTVRVADINPFTLGSDPGQFVRFGSIVLFAADGGSGRELWRTDGTAAGTTLVADIATDRSSSFGTTGSDPTDLAVVGPFVVFAADDGIRGRELWRTDGTAAGTVLVADIDPSIDDTFGEPFPASGAPSAITSFGAVAYFQADDGLTGRELWRTDGTPAGTVLVKDLDPTTTSFASSGPTFPRSGAPTGFLAAGDRVYFQARQATGGTRLWSTDGTFDGTEAVPEPDAQRVTRGVGRAVALGDGVLFAADLGGTNSASPHTRVLVRSDGTAAGTAVVELAPGIGGSWADSLASTGDRAFVAVDDGTHGKELWQVYLSTDPPPFAMITLDRTVLRAGETAMVTFALTSPGTSFGPDAVRVVNGTLSAFTGSGATFTAILEPTPGFTGTATIEVPAATFADEAGTTNTATPPLPLLVDTLAPGVAIRVDVDDREPLTSGRTARLTFLLSEPATDFTADDVTIEGRGPDDTAPLVGTLSEFAGAGTTYTATFTPAPGVVGTAIFRVAAGVFTDPAGNPNLASLPAPVTIDTTPPPPPPPPPPPAVLAAGIDGNPRVWAREFAFTAISPTRIRIARLPPGPARFFGPRGSITLAADGAAEPLSARILGRRYRVAARVLTLDLDTTLPVGATAGVLTVGTTARPAARLLDAETGSVLREIAGTALAAAGYTPTFAARYQGGLRVAAGDADGDGTVDLVVAPGGLPLVGRAAHATTHGTDIHRIALVDGSAAAGWPAAAVDVAAIFGTSGEAGYVVALGDVFADADRGVELVVAAGRRVAVFDIVRGPGGPTIDPEPVIVSDPPVAGTITSVATGAVFTAPLADIVIASTTGTDRVAGDTTVSVLAGPSLAVRRTFAVSARVESGPGRRLVDVFAHGATVAVGDFDGDARGDLAIGAGPRGLGSFRVLANALVTATAREASAAAIADQLGPAGRFAQARPPGAAWRPLGGPDYFTPGEVPRPMGLGFNAPVMVATAATGAPSTGAPVPLFVALGATNQTGNRIRRFAFAGPNAWGIDGEFAQRSVSATGPFAPGLGLRLG